MKRVATALAFVTLLACGAQAAESPTLKAVKARGELICGANGQLAGFGMPDPQKIIGRTLGEPDVLAAAHLYQTATDWHLRKPAL